MIAEPYRTRVHQISVYVDHEFYRKVEREAEERHRKVGPAVLEILREYFERNYNERTRTRKTK